MVKCALALCHSNADVERSLSVNKRMLTKLNAGMSEESVNGLRSTKAGCSGIWSCKQSINNFGDGEISAELIQIVF